ncbi:hypothetical protein LZ016_06415 [Sphingomonas sp. SM33]|uniref:Uncharacterized protein n=1 Tax=Sphingomonas telluris TaxID=2907998 RepID=A0ABS9VL86_9SPHN|nr:hypothetical protein [Sphingomonas telluris]MCH8615732.1 hypothetical protein [Sphingomonas telluris]
MISASECTSRTRLYRFGVAIAVVTSFLIVWTTIVRDDGNGAAFFMVIMAAMVGAFAASFRPAGMARTMLGVAIMQVALGSLIATAPVIASTPDGSLKALVYSAAIAALWLVSATFFRAAARQALPPQ